MEHSTQLSITTVMAGEELIDISSGEKTLAIEDMVILAAIVDGEQKASYNLTVSQAMAVANGLASRAGRIINNQVDDQGKPLGIAARLRALSGTDA